MPASALLIGASIALLKVASLNLCTDELLLTLAAPGQIVSVTHLAHQPQETILWRQARRYPLNDGSLLSVVGHDYDIGTRHQVEDPLQAPIQILKIAVEHAAEGEDVLGLDVFVEFLWKSEFPKRMADAVET